MKNSFFLSQKRLERYRVRGRRYRECEKRFVLALRYLSSSAYKFMVKTFILPTERTLRTWISSINLKPGLDESVLKFFKIILTHWPVRDRIVSIIVDEMSLKQNVSYSAASDTIYGYRECGCNGENHKKLEMVNEVLVLMVKGIAVKYKQVVGYYFSRNGTEAHCLRCIMQKAINEI